MTFLEYYFTLGDNKIGPRHLKNDGLLNTTRPEKPIPDMHKLDKPDGTEELKNNKDKKFIILNNIAKIKELSKKHPYITTLKPGDVKKIIGTDLNITINQKGGFILFRND